MKASRPKEDTRLLLGNEAVARGALEGGIQFAVGYPGTPASEVLETLFVEGKEACHVEWSVNETVAFEQACGAALVGADSLVVMKNAGLNLAMDMLVAVAYTGVRGGLVIVVADDPNAYYSSTEQDTRPLARYAGIMCLEPSNQQEAKDMTRDAVALSKNLELPVFLRLVTRLSHSSGSVVCGDLRTNETSVGFNKHWGGSYRWNVYGPPGPVEKHKGLLEKRAIMLDVANSSSYNGSEQGHSRFGIVASGIGYAFAKEALSDLKLADTRVLKIGTVSPIPTQKCEEFLAGVERALVIEEGLPVVEEQLRILAQEKGLGTRLLGKLGDARLPLHGELTPDVITDVVSELFIGEGTATTGPRGLLLNEKDVPPRSSTLCAGCPHIGTYYALRRALKKHGGRVPIVNGDIGCYEQGGYGVSGTAIAPNDDPSRCYESTTPYTILDTLYVMGSGFGLAQGQVQAGYGDGSVLAVIGDSTFFHAGLPALVNAVWNRMNVVLLIMDNRWTAMTGHQPSPVTGLDGQMREAAALDIPAIVRAIGVEDIHEVDSYNLPAVQEAIQRAIQFQGVSVVISKRECALQVVRREKMVAPGETAVRRHECIKCYECLKLGCPALRLSFDKTAEIDPLLCVNCGMCVSVCPVQAIEYTKGQQDEI